MARRKERADITSCDNITGEGQQCHSIVILGCSVSSRGLGRICRDGFSVGF